MKVRHLIALTFTLAGLAAFAGSAWAEGSTSLADKQQHRVDKRQAHQQARINKGVASGQLTAAETHRLQQQQAHIDRMETRTEADGTVTVKEAARVERAQDHASHAIYRKKHNQRQLP